MQTLFDNGENRAGFRLKYLELYNWGTFDRKIYRVTPDGETSLLTGANGSGKTTIVDALLTLLVPPQKVFYNQSSGAERKRERDTKSYVLGYYGRTQAADQLTSTIQQLRDKKDVYSIILAYFYNESLQQDLTLAQIFWFSNDNLRKTYLVSAAKLNIQEYLTPLDRGRMSNCTKLY